MNIKLLFETQTRFSLFLRLIPSVIPTTMIATPTAAITPPFTVHIGFLYIKELVGPTTDRPCAVNRMPKATIIEPMPIIILKKFTVTFVILMDIKMIALSHRRVIILCSACRFAVEGTEENHGSGLR